MPKGVYDHSKIRGIPKSKEHNEKNRIAHLGKSMPVGFQNGKKNHMWKGSRVGYKSLHQWVYRLCGKRPKRCEKCGVHGKENGTKWSIHWANKSGKYKRERSDWMALCVKHHSEYDRSKKNTNK